MKCVRFKNAPHFMCRKCVGRVDDKRRFRSLPRPSRFRNVMNNSHAAGWVIDVAEFPTSKVVIKEDVIPIIARKKSQAFGYIGNDGQVIALEFVNCRMDTLASIVEKQNFESYSLFSHRSSYSLFPIS